MLGGECGGGGGSVVGQSGGFCCLCACRTVCTGKGRHSGADSIHTHYRDGLTRETLTQQGEKLDNHYKNGQHGRQEGASFCAIWWVQASYFGVYFLEPERPCGVHVEVPAICSANSLKGDGRPAAFVIVLCVSYSVHTISGDRGKGAIAYCYVSIL